MGFPTSTVTENFFERRLRQRKIRPQFIITFLVGIAFALDMVVIYFAMGEARKIYEGVLIMLIILYALIPSGLWIIGTAFTYFIGRLLNARLEFGITLRLFGWGVLPMIGTGLLLSVGRYLALQSRNACRHPAVTCDRTAYVRIQGQVDGIYGFASTAAGDPIFQVLSGVGILLLLLMGYFWIIAAEKASTLTRAGATIAAGIPGLAITVLFAFLVFG